MNPKPYLFEDFIRTLKALEAAIAQENDPYLLLTGETGIGKTAVLRQLSRTLDRCRYRIVYFSQARRLGAVGLVRVLARLMRSTTRRSHSETTQNLVRSLSEDTQRLLLLCDEAHLLPDETFGEAKALVESNLEGPSRVSLILVGLPLLRERLQAQPSLWRRIVLREQITGLLRQELPPFLEHHFGTSDAGRLCEEGLTLLFEHGRGAPGLLLPMFRTALAKLDGQRNIEPSQLEEILTSWDLP